MPNGEMKVRRKMENYELLRNIIENLKTEHFVDARADADLLPDCNEVRKLQATIGAINAQPTEQAFEGTKLAAIALADRLIGRI